MSKISRKLQKIFGINASGNQIAKFGSLAAAAPVRYDGSSADPDNIQVLSNFETGWFGAVIGGNSPAIEDRNSLDFLFSRQIAYLMQAGIAEWNTDTFYYKGSVVNESGRQYVSLTDDNQGNAVTDTSNWLDVTYKNPYLLQNIGLAASVSSGALTISLKQYDGSTDPSPESLSFIGFRDDTNNVGGYENVKVNSAVSTVISNGSTAGHGSGTVEYLHIYALNNSGTVELAWSSAMHDETKLNSTTAEGGAGGADNEDVLYSTTARSNVPIKYLGRIEISEATAGDWQSNPISITVGCENRYKLGKVLTFNSSGTYTRSQGCIAVEVEIIGGGGAGGGAPATIAGQAGQGSGGGAGGYARKFIKVGLNSTETVSIGSGGNGSAGANGGNGGGSDFGSHCSGGGGAGGIASTASSGNRITLGAAGGNASGGNFVGAGSGGSSGWSNGVIAYGGQGGCGYFGGASRGYAESNGSLDGSNGGTRGSGGGGAVNVNAASARSGGNGQNGLCIVREYF